MGFYTPNFNTIRFVDHMTGVGEAHLRERGFHRVTVPRIVPASGACEDVDTLFEITVGGNIRWFEDERRAYFAQTGQLYLEALLGEGGLPRLYCVGPSARAEENVDTRHLTEFEMIEIEFRGTFDDLLAEIEAFITRLVCAIMDVPESERLRNGLPVDLSHLASHPSVFAKIPYRNAIAELGIPWGRDIPSEQEQQLVANHGKVPLLVTRYPNPMCARMRELQESSREKLAIKFFNMIPNPEDPEEVLSCDCIVPFGGECVGSAARVWELEEFRTRLFGSGMFKRLLEKDPQAERGFAWYLGMLQRFPSVPHAGCGFGMSRIFQYLLAETDITKVVVLPSNRARLY